MSNAIDTDTGVKDQDTGIDSDKDTDTDTDTDTTKAKDTPKDKKSDETPEARIARLKRQLEREEKKLGIKKDEPAPKTSDTDYGEEAYLVAKGIEDEAEVALVRKIMKETGKSLKEAVNSKYLQLELKELREDKAASDAIPKGTKKSSAPTKDSVDYWLAKGEMPPNTPENQELRRKYVNEKYNRDTKGSKFAS